MDISRLLIIFDNYLENHFYNNMASWQKALSRFAVKRMLKEPTALKELLMSNGFAKSLNLINAEGMVDVEDIMSDVYDIFEKMDKIEFELPLLGKFCVYKGDFEKLHRMLKDE